jgi:hypothetical protein
MRVHRKCCGLDIHKKMIAAVYLQKMRRATALPRSAYSEP